MFANQSQFVSVYAEAKGIWRYLLTNRRQGQFHQTGGVSGFLLRGTDLHHQLVSIQLLFLKFFQPVPVWEHAAAVRRSLAYMRLTLITQSEQSDKEFLKEICKEDEVIAMALELLASLSVDEATRLAYLRRKDDVTNYNSTIQLLEFPATPKCLLKICWRMSN